METFGFVILLGLIGALCGALIETRNAASDRRTPEDRAEDAREARLLEEYCKRARREEWRQSWEQSKAWRRGPGRLDHAAFTAGRRIRALFRWAAGRHVRRTAH